jgi:hypothetical protein
MATEKFTKTLADMKQKHIASTASLDSKPTKDSIAACANGKCTAPGQDHLKTW